MSTSAPRGRPKLPESDQSVWFSARVPQSVLESLRRISAREGWTFRGRPSVAQAVMWLVEQEIARDPSVSVP